MKTLKKVPVRLEHVQFMPDKKEPNVLYYSKEFHGAGHLCLCGCGHDVYIPIMPGEWSITENEKGFSVTPSLAHRFECKSHYIITDGVANFV